MTVSDYDRVLELFSILVVDKVVLLQKMYEAEHIDAMKVVVDSFEESNRYFLDALKKLVPAPEPAPVPVLEAEVAQGTQEVATEDEDDVE